MTQKQKLGYGPIVSFENLGRPIRLADVLLAIEVNAERTTRQRDAAIIELVGNLYNLREDDLSRQSEAFISFLYDLLFPKANQCSFRNDEGHTPSRCPNCAYDDPKAETQSSKEA